MIPRKSLLTLAAAMLAAAACAQSADAKAPAARTVTVDTRASAGRMNLRLNGGNGYTPIARLQSGGWKVFIKPMEDLHLPIVRTHDAILMDDGVKTVDVHMIFANFRADENNPDNYWFKQTDEYLGNWGEAERLAALPDFGVLEELRKLREEVGNG